MEIIDNLESKCLALSNELSRIRDLKSEQQSLVFFWQRIAMGKMDKFSIAMEKFYEMRTADFKQRIKVIAPDIRGICNNYIEAKSMLDAFYYGWEEAGGTRLSPQQLKALGNDVISQRDC